MPEESLLNFQDNARLPSLSVFIPNYNHGRSIGRAIEAIAAQTVRPLELVIVDDGSTDESVAVLRGYERKYDWIKLIVKSHNQGVGQILEECLVNIRGEYVYFGAADDRVLPGFFESALKLASSSPKVGIIFGQIVAENENQEQLYKIAVGAWRASLCAGPNQFRRECLEREPAGQALVGSTIFRTAALRDVGGFRKELGSWCDSFAWRAAGLRYGSCYLAFPCMAWTVNTESASHTTARDVWQMQKIMQRASALMRSHDFRRDFPEEHVRKWRRGYCAVAWENYVLSWLPHGAAVWLQSNKFLRQARIRMLRTLAR